MSAFMRHVQSVDRERLTVAAHRKGAGADEGEDPVLQGYVGQSARERYLIVRLLDFRILEALFILAVVLIARGGSR